MKNRTDTAHARSPLYRTVLSLAVAAFVAAWLPFTVFYVGGLRHTPVARVTSVTYGHGQRVITTRSSGGTTVPTLPGATGGPQTHPAPAVTTRVS
jgi:hypothetical protein